MTDVGKEQGFRAVHLSERLGTHALLLKGFDVGNGRGNVIGYQRQERIVVFVKSLPRIEACEQKASRFSSSGLRDRQEYAITNRDVAGCFGKIALGKL